MFLRRNTGHTVPDLSTGLLEPEDWEVAQLRTFNYPVDVTCFAINPIASLLAVGTAHGTIHIYGDKPVEVVLSVADGGSIRFLQFGITTHTVVCLDGIDRLHAWDLQNYGYPKHITMARFDPVSFLTMSPSHSHAFIALYSGDVKTYDVGCLRKSFYIIPNLWERYQRKLAGSHRHEFGEVLKVPVEISIHPRDLNTIFIAYSGAVIMYNIAEQTIVHVYELLIPPGAPGGKGYDDKDLLTERYPTVTSMAIHPCGHFFGVGYSDGCIAFWAVEDDDTPLLVQTLDEDDVNRVDAHQLEEFLAKGKNSQSERTIREPVFRLSWSLLGQPSDPRGGDTAVIVLGGNAPGKQGGPTVILFPPFNPPDPPSDTTAPQNALHPFFRTAMRDSLRMLQVHTYDTLGVVQDYLLTPRSSSHFAGCADPTGILILTEATDGARIINAYQFPPPSFVATEAQIKHKEPSDTVDELQAALEEMLINDDPQPMLLPGTLRSANSGLSSGYLMQVEKEAHSSLVDFNGTHEFLDLSLKGGIALPEGQDAALKHTKYQPRRMLLTCHRDLSAHIFDASPQLVAYTPPIPLSSSFPKHIPELSIDLVAVFTDAKVVKAIPTSSLEHQSIASACLAKESLEVALALQTGELVVFRLSPQSSSHHSTEDKEILLIDHIPQGIGRRYAPYFMLAPGRGPVQAYALSDIGFLASSYPDGAMVIVDIRGPSIIYRHGMEQKTAKRHSIGMVLHHSHAPDPITSLAWTICSIDQDPAPQIRLIAVHASGHVEIFSLHRANGGGAAWSVLSEPTDVEGVSHAFSQGTFVIDSKKGFPLSANRERLLAALHKTPLPEAEPLIVMTGSKGARSSNLTGEKLGRVDWGSKVGAVLAVQAIERMGSHALVAFTDHQTTLCYSLPRLEHIHSFQLPTLYSLPPTIDRTGDFILWKAHPKSGRIDQAIYGTLFNLRRAYDPPNIELLTLNNVVPPQPQPVSMGPTSLLGSLFTFNQGLTGERMDEILGGPERPLYVPKPKQVVEKAPAAPAASGSSAAAGVAATATNVQNDLYGRLTSALDERGQLLGDLEERLGALGEGSKNMVAQAKKLAAQESAKAWFRF